MQILLKRLINLDVKKFFWEGYFKMLKVLLIVAPLFLIQFFWASSVWRFFTVFALSMTWLLIAIYFVGTTAEERAVVKNFISLRFNNKVKNIA